MKITAINIFEKNIEYSYIFDNELEGLRFDFKFKKWLSLNLIADSLLKNDIDSYGYRFIEISKKRLCERKNAAKALKIEKKITLSKCRIYAAAHGFKIKRENGKYYIDEFCSNSPEQLMKFMKL